MFSLYICLYHVVLFLFLFLSYLYPYPAMHVMSMCFIEITLDLVLSIWSVEMFLNYETYYYTDRIVKRKKRTIHNVLINLNMSRLLNIVLY